MPYDAKKNFAHSTVATPPSPAISGTTLVVAAGHGTRFPAVPFNMTIHPSGQAPTPANAEIVRVTNIATDTFTIDRAEESSNARTVIAGDIVIAGATAKSFTDIETAVDAIDVSGLEADIDALELDVADLQTDLGTAESNITTLQAFAHYTPVLVSNITTTSSTLADITGLSFSALASKTYHILIHILYTPGATSNGSLFTINGPASPAHVVGHVRRTNNSDVPILSEFNAFDGGTVTGTSGNDPNLAIIEAMVVNGSNPGTIIGRFANEDNTNTLTVVKGYMLYRQLD